MERVGAEERNERFGRVQVVVMALARQKEVEAQVVRSNLKGPEQHKGGGETLP